MSRKWLSLFVLSLALVPWPTQAADDKYEIQLQSGRFTPQAGISKSVEGLSQSAAELKAKGRSKVHVLVQLYQIPKEGEKANLASEGLELGTYVPRHAWIASVPVDRLQQLTKRKGIRYMTLWDADHKIQPRLKAGNVSEWARDEAQPDRIKVHVELHADVDLSRGHRLAAEVGATDVAVIEGVRGFEFWMPEKELRRLAEEEDVLWIEEAAPPLSPFNDGARGTMKSTLFWGAPYGLDGSGVRLFVLDTSSALATHVTFNPGTGSRVTVIDASAPGEHATHVAGTAAGDGSGSIGGRALGIATASPILSGAAATSADIEPRYQTARNTHNADLGTNSIGFAIADSASPCSAEGDYTSTGNLLDGIVRGTNVNVNGSVLLTWANGNERGAGTPPGRCGGGYGTTSPPSCAKNPLHIGATYSDGSAMTSFSSWGPCDDGRLKPVVSAPGCETGLVTGETGIYSSTCNSTPTGPCNLINTYGTQCGTSMATPAVAGVIAQYIEDWRARGFGGPNARPLPALVKALVVQTARDLGQNGPDYIYGYGTVEARALIELSRAGNGSLNGASRKRWGTGSLIQAQTHNYTIQVPAGGGELKASLAWDDAPAPSLSNGALVNNLDLLLIEPNGVTIHRPWTLNAASPHLAATTGINNIDNQEQVLVVNPTAGNWTVRVVGTTVAQGPQTYGLTFTSEPRPYNPGTCTTTASGYETGNDSWTLQGGAARVAAPAAGHGSWSLRLGGATGTPGNPLQNAAYRDFTIPAWASHAELSFYWHMTTQENQASGWNWDYFLFEVLTPGGTMLAVPDLRFDGWRAGQWLHQAHVDLSPWRGQTIRLRFRSVNDDSLPTTFWVDDILLNLCQRTDVWSRDLSTDVGNEPGVPGNMWTSPDVWVRRQIDTSTVHQNPLINTTNQIKVNVRNRSTVTAPSVTVEAYVANGSTALAWPGSWTFVGSTTLANVAPGGPVVAQIPWVPTALGHYCILIRLVADGDSMTFPEVGDVNYNTRQNNNIVWRNVNIVQFPWQFAANRAAGIGEEDTDPDDGHVQFIVRNLEPGETKLYLQFRERSEKLDHTFLQRGEIGVTLPEELAKLWNEAGNEGEGIERVDDLHFRVLREDAHITVLVPEKAEFTITMDIVDTGAPPVGEALTGADEDEEDGLTTYLFDVIQHVTPESMHNPELDPVGGVTYEIKAAPITPIK